MPEDRSVFYPAFSYNRKFQETFGSGTLSAIMQAPEEAFSETTAYIRICSAGAAFIIAYNVLGSMFRGIGDSKMPLLTVAITCLSYLFYTYVLYFDAQNHIGVPTSIKLPSKS